MCSVFHKGLQRCVSNQASWPTVWYDTQNQHCTALLNIVTQKLDDLEESILSSAVTTKPEVNSSSTVATQTVNTTEGDSVSSNPDFIISEWTDFGIGFGFGLIGYLILTGLKHLCHRGLNLIVDRCDRFLTRTTQPCNKFAFVRGAPAKLPNELAAISAEHSKTMIPQPNRHLDSVV